MKKVEITCSACIPVLKGIIQYFTDIKYFFKPEFKTERYYLHFFLSLAIALPIIAGLLFMSHLETTPLLYQIFIGAFITYGINWHRENKKMDPEKGVPFSQTDVNFGSYGGAIAPLIIKLILLLVCYEIKF